MTSCGPTFACPDCGEVKSLRESVLLSAKRDGVMWRSWRSCGRCALRLVSDGRAQLIPSAG